MLGGQQNFNFAPGPDGNRILLGKGAFSTVWLGTSGDRQVAIKVIEYKKFKPLERTYLDREVEIMGKLDHPNLLKMLFHQVRIVAPRLSQLQRTPDGLLYLVLEKMSCELKTFITETKGGFPEDIARSFMTQIGKFASFLPTF